MSSTKLVLVAGFAIFSMFFGSGNLVFPLMIGVESMGSYHMASAGLMITGVMIPLCGLIGMLYSHGNRLLFFAKLGKPIGFLVTLILLSLLGPFAVVPRCTIVAHGGFSLIAPDMGAPLYNALFLGATMIMAWKKTRIIDVIGTYLTPFLLGGIVMIIITSLVSAPDAPSSILTNAQSFSLGITQGYQTMDLLAAFFFSATAITFIAQHLKTHEQKQKLESYGITAALLGTFLLGLIYMGFVTLGAKYAPLLQGVEPEQLLVTVAVASLGEFALPISTVVIGLACLTTASILTSLFVDFMDEDVFAKKIPRTALLGLTILCAYTLSLLGFASLAHWIGFVLVFIYPSLIVYSVLFILQKKVPALRSYQALSTYGFYVTLVGVISAHLAT